MALFSDNAGACPRRVLLMVREEILNHEIHGINEIGEEGTGNGY